MTSLVGPIGSIIPGVKLAFNPSFEQQQIFVLLHPLQNNVAEAEDAFLSNTTKKKYQSSVSQAEPL